RKGRAQLRQDTALVKLLRTAVEQASDDDGWANMGMVASYISNNNSSFSSINYGYKKISDLIRTTELFQIEMRNGTAMYIRDPKG
ncbi:MAG TPA: hypothetical protein DEG86_02165, partial [Halieaceae bacterium]|nr:hypothetical protein [Halieaceae bacterium]